MFTSETGISTQPEARGCIYACLGAEDPRAAVEELIGDVETADDLNLLKVAEFALLKEPAITGMRNYLEDPFSYAAGAESSDEQQLGVQVGLKIVATTREALSDDPDHDLAAQINQRRAKVMEEHGYQSDTIRGIFDKLDKAARSAAITTGTAVMLNALEIADTTDLHKSQDRERFIEAVKSSGGLLRALTRVHLQQTTFAHRVVSMHAFAIEEGKKQSSINSGGLQTDAEGAAHLEIPLKDWKHPVGGFKRGGHTYTVVDKLGNMELRDVQIGCLLSFEPQLATSFYRHYVDLMERYQVWPEELRTQPKESE